MESVSYKRPPIIEAVIEITFKKPHDTGKLEKFTKKIGSFYQNSQISTGYRLDIDIKNIKKAEPQTKKIPHPVHRFSSGDMTEILFINESTFTVSQLAPYCGWEDFLKRFSRDWKVWKKILGFNEIEQIGVRYINRLDIPVDMPTVTFSEYVNIYPKAPEALGPNSSYSMQIQIPLFEEKSMLVLNSAVVKSPIPKHMSLIIDQDIIKNSEVPQNDDSIIEYLNIIHTRKNTIFESCVTDKARELFDK